MRNITTPKTLLIGLLCSCVLAPCSVKAGVNTWTPIGPDGGRVYDVEFSQTSPGTFYALGRSGVYRSTVAGDSFELLKEDFERPAFDLAVDPTRADRVLVAADALQIGVGGAWTRAATASEQGAKVATSRDGSTMYFAASGARIFRSQDHGMTWQERTPLPGASATSLVNALGVDPTSPNVVYANTFGDGLFVSTDGGGVWQRLGGGDPAMIRILNFVVDPSNPLRLLAATNDAGLRISDDRGLTWNPTNVTTQTWDVDVDPRNSSVIYVSEFDIRKSEDNGATWRVLPVDQPHRILRLVIDPTEPSRLAAFNGEGVSISTDGGATWAKRIAGFKGTRPTKFSPLPSSRRNYFGVSESGGVYYLDAGDSFAHALINDPLVLMSTPPGGPIAIEVLALPGNRDALYAVLNAQVLAQSLDAGLHWTKLPSPSTFINTVAASPLEPRTLYAGAFPGGVYKSLDGGASWAASATGLPDQLNVYAIAIASTPSTLYAIGQVIDNTPGAMLQWAMYRSGDSGVTWSAASPQSQSIVSVTVDPNDAQAVYAGFDSELRKTTDGGATWSTFTSGAFRLCCTFRGVVFDPTDSRVLYAQHSGGVWRTVDAGASWQSVLPPFRSASADSRGALALDPENRHRLLMGWTELGVRELTIAPDLELTMTAPASLGANAPATYTLTLRNTGAFDASNVRVTAQLPAGATGPSVGATGASCTLAATTATCVFAVVRSSGNAAISLSFVPSSLPSLVSASVTGDEPDPVSANNVANRTIGAAAPAAGGGGGGAISLGALVVLIALVSLRARPKSR